MAANGAAGDSAKRKKATESFLRGSSTVSSPRSKSMSSQKKDWSKYIDKDCTNKGPKRKDDICIGEELKISVNIALERFRMSEDQKELEFPSALSATERAYIHRLCQSLGLKSKSKGKGNNRYLTVAQKDRTYLRQVTARLPLERSSRHQAHSLLQRFPVTNKERQDLQPCSERSQYSDSSSGELSKTTTGRLNNGVPQVPPKRGTSDLSKFRQSLPVYLMKDVISHHINENRVVLIAGETGSGKTTQVPQMILDDCQAQKKTCRIFCTQPRRLAALSIAERVAAERGEKIGQTVGYQIRLESRVSPKTLLTFCTNGVLLRTLMGGINSMATVTHIIVDEIHERDRFSDFLLIALREVLPKFRHLKIVLMSATLNVHLFSKYFSGCPIVNVPGKLFDVQEFFLEDVLKVTGHTNKEMEKYKKELSKGESQQKQLDDWCNKDISDLDLNEPLNFEEELQAMKKLSVYDNKTMEIGEEKEELEAWIIQEMDHLLTQIWLTGNDELFQQIFHLIMSENVSVDYAHSETSATPLMIAAGRGFFEIVEQLLSLGTNINIRARNDWTALDWAKKFEHTDIIELLEAHIASTEEADREDSLLVNQASALTPEDRDLLNVYHHSFDDDKVDLDLILSLLHKIHCSLQEGAILVFLPGYDEIIGLRDKILEDKSFQDSNRSISPAHLSGSSQQSWRYNLYTLHSQMQSSDQKRVFKTPPAGVRKIILSTNIAETSITINDVVFVIDSGKVKEKSYDALTSVSMLKAHWISKASASQRKGRAGRCRPGVCYHLFSRVRYNSLQEFQDPEILRYPLQELCLHTKLLAPANCSIADFLAKAPEPPSFLLSRNAVHILKQIDALDTNENLTELGLHLTDLPLEPRYGKMILYSVVLKCLDPVLTIACSLAYKDPFQIPSQPYQKRAAVMSRRKYSAGTYSDHMALLRAYQAWQKAKTEGWERSFCEKNFISGATMDMIVGMRTNILGQLRASGFVRARGGGDIRDLNTNSENWAVVKAALCAGSYPSILRVDRLHNQLCTVRENKVRCHNASVLSPAPNMSGTNSHAQSISALPTEWLIYEEMTRAHRLAQVKGCTSITPATIAIMAGPAKLSQEIIREAESGGHIGQGDCVQDNSDSDEDGRVGERSAHLRVDEWISFSADPEASSLIVNLRQKWHALFMRRMRGPAKPWSQMDDNVIRAVVSVLSSEEQAHGLQQPTGIGQRPRPMSAENTVLSGGGSRESSVVDSEEDSDSSDRVTPSRGRLTQFSRYQGGTFHDHRQTRDGAQQQIGNNLQTLTSAQREMAAQGNSDPQLNSASSNPRVNSVSSDPSVNLSSTEQSARYFVMKSNNHRNLDISNQKAIWATNVKNENMINEAFKERKTVYLIFSVQGSGHFQGYAIMKSTVGNDKCKDFTGSGLGSTFAVEWVKRGNLPFQQCHHLLNPWNDNQKVQVSRDGQEIDPNVGAQLIKLWGGIPPYMSLAPRRHKGPLHNQGPYHANHDMGFHSSKVQPHGNVWGRGGKGYQGQEAWGPAHHYGPPPIPFTSDYGSIIPTEALFSAAFSGSQVALSSGHLTPLFVNPLASQSHCLGSSSSGSYGCSSSSGEVSPVVILQRRGVHQGQERVPSSSHRASPQLTFNTHRN